MYDILIKGGLVVDGSGAPGFAADVAVKDGRIAAIGPDLAGEAREVVEADGRVVAPGFIDPHTHFDVQLLWDGAARPALEHGITSIVPGNCSLSLAPLKAGRPQAPGRHVPADRGDAARSLHRGVRLDLGGFRRLSRRASRRTCRSMSRRWSATA